MRPGDRPDPPKRPPAPPKPPKPPPRPSPAREPKDGGRPPVPGAPRVVVMFAEHLDLPYDATTEAVLLDLEVGSVDELRAEFPGLRLKPIFQARKPAVLAARIERHLARNPGARKSRVMSFYYAEADKGHDAEALAAAFRAWPDVESAYVSPPPTVPPSPAPPSSVTRFDELDPPNPDGADQHHLDDADSAHVGIGAAWAWALPGGDGSQVQFADIEDGWNPDHEDLAAHAIGTPIYGGSHDHIPHGTRALGVVAALDNAKMCIGVAPGLSRIVTASRLDANSMTEDGRFFDNTASAIQTASAELSKGDVILIELQTSVGAVQKVPVEAHPAVREAIYHATAVDQVVVVEAAGNGGVDLDTLKDPNGKTSMNPGSSDFYDSGAILVAAAIAPALTRKSNSCHGKRIDCCSWGHSVVTLSTDDDGNEDLTTTGSFEDTSAASAIVAGAAVVVQSAAKAAGMTLSPAQVRTYLSRSDLNTPPDPADAGRIGHQPDLKTILKLGLGLAPDVYLRDHVGDDGDPHVGKISASPDVILRKAPVAGDPGTVYGEGSGTEDDAKLGEAAEHGDTNHLYVRVRNRGGSPALGVQATLHWSQPATLAMPALWTPVGTTAPAVDVPHGDVLTVLPRLDWAGAPTPGHYCFIAELDDPWDPAPPSSTLTTLPAFKDHIRQHNNITWRNFNVVGPTGVPGGPSGPPADPGAGLGGPPAMGFPDPPPGSKTWALPFQAVGAPDGVHPMQLQIVAKLPAHMLVGVEMPVGLYFALAEPRPDDIVDLIRGRALVRMPTFGTHVVLDGDWPAVARHECHLVLLLLQGNSVTRRSIALRQVFEGVEVGRVTWVTRPTLA